MVSLGKLKRIELFYRVGANLLPPRSRKRQEFIEAGSTMLELGAYWGYYSLWFKKHVPNARTILVEPDMTNLNLGRLNYLIIAEHTPAESYSVDGLIAARRKELDGIDKVDIAKRR